MDEKSNWKAVTYLVGAAAGMVTGLFAAFLIIRKRENQQGNFIVSSSDGMKVGMSLVSLLKMISDLGTK